ncbi:MAG: hypothetical protein RL757_1309 [Bacteroidota bacterium]|jgi:metallo-beta-lactamase family protein
MTIQFCGAAQEVTGSCHLLTLDDGFTILLDCGLYQGNSDNMKDFNEKWLFNPATIDCMVLSHAHIDHTGRIPRLVKDGFRGKIYATHATRDLAAIMMLDSAEIQENDRKHQPAFYETQDVTQAMGQFVSYGYNNWFNIRDNVKVFFADAGHILGSASVTFEVTEENKTVRFGFSGDIGRYNRPILRDPQPMPELDYLVCESTYGNKLHQEKPDETARFANIVRETCVEKGGKIIIPAFSIGRTQEIVHLLDVLIGEGKLPPVTTYVDSPLAIDATDIFVKHPECFDDEILQFLLRNPNPFGFKSLKFLKSSNESRALKDSNEPCIIIASSGMATGGRIRQHLENYVSNPTATIMIVGYAAPNTPAGQLRNGNKQVRIFKDKREVKARVEVMESFSAHADYSEILRFLEGKNQRLKQMWLVHGELESQQGFKTRLENAGFANVTIPKLGDIAEISF